MNDLDFKSTVAEHADELFAYALRLTRTRAEAEDLVQSTLVRALERWRQLREPSAVRAWLFRILRSRWIDERRRKASRAPVLEIVSDEELQAIPADGAAFERLLPEEVQEALDRLPHPAQEVVLLADVWGFEYPEIASILECPVGTVRSRLHRARVRLAEELTEYAKDRGYLGPRKEGAS